MNNNDMKINEDNREQILKLLEKFQEGYSKRDLNKVDSFMDEIFVKDDNLLVIGTSAIGIDSDEWCEGYEKVKSLIKDDWKYWGDLRLNIDKARISLESDSACISIEGIVSEIMKNENYYKFRLDLIKQTLEKEDSSSRTKLIEILQGASDTLNETNKGEEYNWPVRISGMMVKVESRWLFKHLHFSYPITFYPPVRK